MRFVCEAKDLREAVHKVGNVKSDTVLLVFDGGVWLASCDVGTMGISTFLETKEASGSGWVAVMMKPLLGLVSKLDGYVEVMRGDGGMVFRYRGGRVELPTTEFARTWVLDESCRERRKVATVPLDLLKDALKRVRYATSKDATKVAMTGVFFEFDQDTVTLTATDGYRLATSSFSSGCPAPGTSFIVPREALDVLVRLFSRGEVEIATSGEDDNIAVFSGRGTKLFAVLVSGKFPEYRSLFSEEYGCTVKVDRMRLIDALRRVSAVLFETPVIGFEANGGVVLTAEGNGKAVEELEAKVEGSIKLFCNAKHLLDVLQVLFDPEVEIHFSGEMSPALLKGTSLDYLFMPVKPAPSVRG